MDRISTLEVVTSVAPALSDNDLVPAFGCFFFRKGRLCAYNNAIGMSAPFDFPVKAGGVDGKLMLRFLKSASGLEVNAKDNDGDLQLSCGRSRMKLRIVPKSEFSFRTPKMRNSSIIRLDDDQCTVMQSAMARTAISAGIDPTRPDTLGVLLEFTDHGVLMYATDNYTAAASVVEVPVPMELVGKTLSIPPEAVKTLTGVPSSLFSSITVDTGWMLFRDPSGLELFSRTIRQDGASMYHEAFMGERMTEDAGWLTITDELAPAFARAGFLVSDSVFTSVTIKKGRMILKTRARGSDIHDEVKLEGKGCNGHLMVNPLSVSRCLDHVDQMKLISGLGLVFKGPDYMHIVSRVLEE